MNSMDLFFDDEEEDIADNLALARRIIRDSSNPLELPNSCFKKTFRLSKEAFKYVLEEISPFLQIRKSSTAVPTMLKLAASLRFFAEGSYQTGVGNDFSCAISQPSFSNILTEVLNIFNEHVCQKWISFAMTTEEKEEAKLWFYEKTGFPGVIGCVDGIHVRIVTPDKEIQHLYYNRKGFHSINAMLVCDHKMRIRCIDARHPGSCHDSFIWENCDIKPFIEQRLVEGETDTWILGDSGYPLQPVLITPFRTTVVGSNEAAFNRVHSKARNVVEKTIAVLKNRFNCISGARELHYKPEKVTQIINACSCLHNICLHFNLDEDTEFVEEDPDTSQVYDFNDNNESAITIRNTILHNIVDQ